MEGLNKNLSFDPDSQAFEDFDSAVRDEAEADGPRCFGYVLTLVRANIRQKTIPPTLSSSELENEARG